jgi:hypothetical protein
VGVDGRHRALPIESYDPLTDFGERNDHWIDVAEDLAEQPICRALTRASLWETDLDAIFICLGDGNCRAFDCYASHAPKTAQAREKCIAEFKQQACRELSKENRQAAKRLAPPLLD